MKFRSFNVLLATFLVASVVMTFSGCGQSGNGLATEQGSMTMEEYQKIKEAEDKAIAEGMQSEVGKKP
ncbi:MAG: hypothetical protein ACO1RT_13880 [Planctomycetaceae bacterium]